MCYFASIVSLPETQVPGVEAQMQETTFLTFLYIVLGWF